MPTMNISPLKPRPNTTVMDAIRAEASPDYRNRVPAATQAGIEATVARLHEHRPSYNEFVDALVNRIGSVVARNISWTNPLAEFKRGMLNFGDTIEEIQTGLLKAHTYDPDRESMERAVFGTEVPPAESNFHKINRQEYYKITVNEPLLRRAFLEEGGLTEFVSQLMQAPSTSDQWDEFLMTCQLFSEYENNGGFFHVKVPDISRIESNGDDARVALRKMRAMADTLPFVSTKYNAAGMPTFAKRDDLLLFVTPEFNAAIDVEALAGAFNQERANMRGRIITIPRDQFDIPGCEAIMTTSDFFVIADSRLENASIYNPASLSSNYFLHHWQVISASRFVPAVQFSTEKDDEVINVRHYPDTVAIAGVYDREDKKVTSVVRGEIYEARQLVTLTDEDKKPDEFFSDAVMWRVTGNSSTRTHITDTGILHVAGDENAAKITVSAVLVDADPSKAAPSASADLTVTGPSLPGWPRD